MNRIYEKRVTMVYKAKNQRRLSHIFNRKCHLFPIQDQYTGQYSIWNSLLPPTPLIYLFLSTGPSPISGQQITGKDILCWNSPWSSQIRLYSDLFLLLVKKQHLLWPPKAQWAWILYDDYYYLDVQEHPRQIKAKFRSRGRRGSWGCCFPRVQVSPHQRAIPVPRFHQHWGGGRLMLLPWGCSLKPWESVHVNNTPCQAAKWWFCCQRGNKAVLQEQG